MSDEEIIDEADSTPIDPVRAAFAWWAKRRLRYNLIVGLSGVITLVIMDSFGSLELILAIIYGIFANLCYTSGFLLTALDLHFFNSALGLYAIRNGLYTLGLVFSIALTIFACVTYANYPYL